jgi:ketopantoate reductase
MDITIIGPGAVGTLLGGLLRLKGHTVALRGRKPAERRDGTVRLQLPDRWLLAEGVRFEGPEEPVRAPDLHLVTLGRQHMHAERRPDFLRLIAGGEAPVAVFNADPVEAERLAIPPDRLCSGFTLMNAVKLQALDVELTSPAYAIIHEKSRSLGKAMQDLSRFGFQTIAVDDAQPYGNSLFLTQLLFLPVAMCNTTLDCFLSTTAGRELAGSILAEGLETMERAGLPLAPLPLMDPRELAVRLEKKPGSFEAAPPKPDRGYNSVLQCYLKGRPTEAAQLNKRIVEIASSAGLHLTWNWRILQKASRVAGVGFYQDPAQLLKSLE